MFDVLKLEILNFKSFRGKHSIELPTEPGVYWLTGDNQTNPRLGPNGVGKSTLLEAIHWCLYGKTSRGLKAADIITWGEKHAYVTLHLKVGAETLKVTRKQAPNSLTLNDTPLEQDALDKALRLNQQGFVSSIMLPQFGGSFFNLKPSEKLDLFTEILNLDYWLKRAKVADDLAKTIIAEKVEEERLLANGDGRLVEISTNIDNLLVQEKGFEKQRDTRINDIKIGITNNQNLLKLLEPEIKDLERVLAGNEGRSNKLGDQFSKLNTTLEDQTEEYNKLNTHCAVLAQEVDRLMDELKGMDQLGAECPRCFQPVPKLHVAAHKKELNREIEKAARAFDDTKADRNAADADVKATKAAIEKLKQDQRALETNKRDFEQQLRGKKQEFEAAQREKASLQQNLTIETVAENPFATMIKAEQTKLGTLKKQLADARRKVTGLINEHTAVSYWATEFKRVRLFIIEQTLRQLEVEVNNSLATLGLVDWHIEFDVEHENKSGGITRGFVVLIHSPEHDKPVRFEAWSGGETQRLCLAGDLGLAGLIMEQAGLEAKIEFYDEPSSHLSTEGLLDLAETLYQRAKSGNKRILLVDHHVIDFGGFEDKLVVVRDQAGSRLLG